MNACNGKLGLLGADAKVKVTHIEASANDNDPTPGRKIMAMLTPSPFMMRPTSFEHFALFHNFSDA